MFKLSVLLFMLSFSAVAEKCNVDMFPQIVFLDKVKVINDLNKAYKTSTCSNKTIWNVFQTLNLIDGDISERHLNRLLKEEGFSGSVTINPKKIEIKKIDAVIGKKLTIQRGRKVKNVKSMNNFPVLGLEKNSYYEIACHACNTTGKKNASFVYTDPVNNLQKRVWVQFDILKTDQVAIAQTDLRPFANQEISHNVKLIPTEMEDTSLYLKDLENLKYYKPNKVIKKGDPIKFSDLVPKTLVQTGKLTQVSIKKGNLNIQTQAISRQSGKLDDVINLYNPQTKKQFRGKVTDYNKVVVEL